MEQKKVALALDIYCTYMVSLNLPLQTELSSPTCSLNPATPSCLER